MMSARSEFWHKRNMESSVKRKLLVVSMGCVIAGCGIGTDSKKEETAASMLAAVMPSNAPASAPVAGSGIVSGQVINGLDGSPIAGVTVRAGAVTATSNAAGYFSLTVASSDRAVVSFEASNYAEGSTVIQVTPNQTTEIQSRLVPVGVNTILPITVGGVVSVPSSQARVTLLPNSVQRADGSIPTGNVSVSLTAINPSVDTSIMPGDFTTLQAGRPVPIESFGAINVQLKDASGAPVNLKPGQTAVIRIPVSTRSSDIPTTIPLYFYDNTTGRWKEEGMAALVGTGANSYYEGTVSHFSTWNADRLYVNRTILVKGCVTDVDGNPVNNLRIRSDGINFTGTTTTVDTNGQFSLPVMKGGEAIIYGQKNIGQSKTNAVKIGPSQSDITLSQCLIFGQRGAGLTMTLTWGARPSDLDSHLFAPNGEHVWYGGQGSLADSPFANLDVDDTDSYGPEVVTISKLMVGTYKYSVHNYSTYFEGSITGSSARVELNIPTLAPQILSVPTGEQSSTDWWNLFEIDVDARCNLSVRRVQTFTASNPAHPMATPTYCTP
jgi:hypothetical protein